MEQEQKPRERSFIRELVPDWRPAREQALWATRIAIVLGVLIAIGYAYGITLWEWVKLLIVPAAIAGAGLWFNQQQRKRELEIADQRAQTDREIADQRRQDDTLQAYLEGISQLLTDKQRPLHRAQVGDSLSTVARARTLTVLSRLDGERKGSVVRFLYESGLITRDRAVLDLTGADLRGADLSFADLSFADLAAAGVSGTDLRGADLRGASLFHANLRGANLRGADLDRPILVGADLSNADLSGVNLSGAELMDADLTFAKLVGTDLRRAHLNRVRGVTNDELWQLVHQPEFLEDVTMPNGQKYEDWLKSKGSGEAGENE